MEHLPHLHPLGRDTNHQEEALSAPTVLLPADLDQARQIMIAWGHFLALEIEAAMEVGGEAAHHPFQDYIGLAIKQGEQLAGWIVFGPIPMTDRCWQLYWLVVAPPLARQGIGQRLMAAMTETVQQEQGRQLHLDTSSLPAYLPARRFYEKNGFRLVAQLPDFFRKGSHKLLYVA